MTIAEFKSGELAFDEKAHRYYLGQLELPGVTRVLDRFLIDFSKVNPDDLERARILGDQVHKATALDDHGILDEEDLEKNLPHVMPYLRGWRKFRREMEFEPVMIEWRGYHPIYFYAGTLDRGGFIRGDTNTFILPDIKRRDLLTPDVGPQTAAYEEIVKRTTDLNVARTRRACVRLFEESYKFDWLDSPSDFSVFLSCLTLFNYQRQHAKYFRVT